MIQELRETEKAAPLFAGWQETMIWSCLQGVMGKIYVTSQEDPVSAMAVLGDFCFLAGKPDRKFLFAGKMPGRLQKTALAAGDGADTRQQSEKSGEEPDQRGQIGEKAGFMILVPGNEGWAELIEECPGGKAGKVVRYAVKKEPDVFDREKLRETAEKVPAGYELKLMERDLFERCGKIGWCRDWVAQYSDYDTYQKYGLGAVLLKDGEPVSGASSYSGYIGGIEVEIDTREDHRRRGLASVCGARLILECLDRGWYPSWDAQNKWSLALAEKLGYHFDREYAAYEVNCG